MSMNINILRFDSLDVKSSIKFFETLEHETLETNLESIIGDDLYKLQLLTSNECDIILNKLENEGYDDISFDIYKRKIVYDSEHTLSKLIRRRIQNVKNEDNLKAEPYGFGNGTIDWNYGEIKINPCFRSNKYVNNSKSWHRDAQYTESSLVRSNYSIIIFLNDDYEGGEFCILNKQCDFYDGRTIEEEMDRYDDLENSIIRIKPQKGMAIIINQRLIHSSNIVFGTKYILRSDLIVTGKSNGNNIGEIEKRVKDLTHGLFRQAEYRDMNNMTSNDLYEICINLRQYPHLITEYPKRLDRLLMVRGNKIDIFSTLKFKGRSGNTHSFEYKGTNTILMIKISTLFTIFCEVCDPESFIEYFKDILRDFGIEIDPVSFTGKHFSEFQTQLDFNRLTFENVSTICDSIDFDHKFAREYNSDSEDYENDSDSEDNPNSEDNEKKYDELFDITEFVYKEYEMYKLYGPSRFNPNDKKLAKNLLKSTKIIHESNETKPLEIIEESYIANCKYINGPCSNARGGNICSECGHKPYNIDNLKYLYGKHFSITNGDFILEISSLRNDGNVLSGEIIVKTPAESFNYAACNQYHNKTILNSLDKTMKIIKYELSFTCTEDEINIHFIPKIDM